MRVEAKPRTGTVLLGDQTHRRNSEHLYYLYRGEGGVHHRIQPWILTVVQVTDTE